MGWEVGGAEGGWGDFSIYMYMYEAEFLRSIVD